MSDEIPPLQSSALNAVRSGDDNAQTELINNILNDGVTAAEYLSMKNTVTGLKAEARRIVSRIGRHLDRAKTLDASGQHSEARELRESISNDTALLSDLRGFTLRLSGQVTHGRVDTKLRETLSSAARIAAEWFADVGSQLKEYSTPRQSSSDD